MYVENRMNALHAGCFAVDCKQEELSKELTSTS